MTPSRRSGSPAAAPEFFLLSILLPSLCFCQDNDVVKVVGKRNPFYVESADVVTKRTFGSREVYITGKVYNRGPESLLRIQIEVRAKSSSGKTITGLVTMGYLAPGEFEAFELRLHGVAAAAEVESATYHAVTLATETEVRDIERSIQQSRIQFCRRIKQTLGNKPVGSLTTNEQDTITSCKVDGYW